MVISADRSKTIQRASRSLLVFFIFMSVISLLGMLNQMTHPFPPDTRTLAGVVFQGAALTGKIQILWLVQLVLGAALTLKILYHLIRLMVLYARGRVFTAQNVAQIRQIGLTYACTPAVWLIVLIGAWHEIAVAQDQWVKIMPSFPGGDIIASCIFLFGSRIMNEGRELRDEQDLVV
jgi:Protein of unknown function (DUF2975)